MLTNSWRCLRLAVPPYASARREISMISLLLQAHAYFAGIRQFSAADADRDVMESRATRVLGLLRFDVGRSHHLGWRPDIAQPDAFAGDLVAFKSARDEYDRVHVKHVESRHHDRAA